MKFSVEHDGQLAIFHLGEERLTAENAPEVKRELLILTQSEITVLMLDLTPVSFCDSSGLSAILLAERQMREHEDGGVIVVDVHGKVKTLIEIAKLDGIIPVFETVEEARKAIVE